MFAAGLKKALLSSAFFIALSAAVAAPTETVTVRYVPDGDSLILADGRQVRLIGINTPEFGKDGAPHQPLAKPARERLAELIGKQRITLAPEQERRDHYGRLLARAILPDGSDAGERLLREAEPEIRGRVRTPGRLVDFDGDGYAYDEARSTKDQPVYVR